VECATSYLARLAYAHSVSVGILFCREAVPLVYKQYLSKKDFLSRPGMIMGGRFMDLAKSLNGTGSIARKWIGALETLTSRKDLHCLTMITWDKVLANRDLFRSKQVWCPLCYEEGYQEEEQTVYQPLLWTFKVITSCVRHQLRLRTSCKNCNRQHNLLTARSIPGFCPYCKNWLGASDTSIAPDGLTDEELEWQAWVTAQVGELLASASTVSPPEKRAIADSFNKYIAKVTKGNTSLFAKNVNIPRPSVGKWLRGDQVPTLKALLQVCFHNNISLLDFIAGEITETDLPNLTNAAAPNNPTGYNQKRRGRKRDITPEEEIQIKRIFEEAIREEPPPLLREVAQRVGRNPNSLQYRFPDLCSAITARYGRYQKAAKREINKRMLRELNKAIHGENQFHSLVEFAKFYGWSFKILRHRFPKQCRAFTKRCADGRNQKWSELEKALKSALNEKPPPSLKAFARRHKIHTAILYQRYKELCRKLSKAHKVYRSVKAL
jgi:hypothetical protein